MRLKAVIPFALCPALLALACSATVVRAAEPDVWLGIQKDVFGDRAIEDGSGIVTLYAPENAEDAALVPVSIRFSASRANDIKALHLVVDRNPAPVAATVRFGDGFTASAELGERLFETRVRVDSFAKVRAIAETKDGKLFMAARFVAGAGGCSSTGGKDPEEALAGMGAIRIKTLADANRGANWRESVVMIKHPNFTGMQMNPKSGGYTPARFVDDIEVTSGGQLMFKVQGGISISENPHFRFNHGPVPGETIEVRARDTEGASFTGRSQPSGS